MQDKRNREAYDVCASVALPCDMKRTRSQARKDFNEIFQKSQLYEYFQNDVHTGIHWRLTKSVAI